MFAIRITNYGIDISASIKSKTRMHLSCLKYKMTAMPTSPATSYSSEPCFILQQSQPSEVPQTGNLRLVREVRVRRTWVLANSCIMSG